MPTHTTKLYAKLRITRCEPLLRTFSALGPSCSDRIKNAYETDVDCGGACQKCTNDRACIVHTDCVSEFCSSRTCKRKSLLINRVLPICLALSEPTCSDGIRNRDETDVDCGGKICPKCIDTKVCNVRSDCVNEVCTSNICQGKSAFVLIVLQFIAPFSAPSCNDGIRNRDETDVDCGGEICPKCVDTKVCNVRSDCTSGVCESNICQGEFLVHCNTLFYVHYHFSVPSCSDGIRNRDETDIDCGSTSCPKCIDTKVCNGGSDCTSGVCTFKICQGEYFVVF